MIFIIVHTVVHDSIRILTTENFYDYITYII